MEILSLLLFIGLLYIVYRIIKSIGRSIVAVYVGTCDALRAARPLKPDVKLSARVDKIEKNLETIKGIADDNYHKQICGEIDDLEKQINEKDY